MPYSASHYEAAPRAILPLPVARHIGAGSGPGKCRSPWHRDAPDPEHLVASPGDIAASGCSRHTRSAQRALSADIGAALPPRSPVVSLMLEYLLVRRPFPQPHLRTTGYAELRVVVEPVPKQGQSIRLPHAILIRRDGSVPGTGRQCSGRHDGSRPVRATMPSRRVAASGMRAAGPNGSGPNRSKNRSTRSRSASSTRRS